MDKTLDHYNRNADEYFARTKNISLESAYPTLLKRIPEGGHILDLGAGSGRDSRFFLDKGYQVTAIDGSIRLAKIAHKRLGIPVITKKFHEISFKDTFDAVWASASLLHLRETELKGIVSKLFIALKAGGFLYASFKFGQGDFEDKDGRFFNLQNFSSITNMFELDQTEIQLIELQESYNNQASHKWIIVLVLKKH